MKTKTSIFGVNTPSQKPKKAIELTYLLDGNFDIIESKEHCISITEFDNIALLVRDYGEYKNEGYFDLILGYESSNPHKDPTSTCLFLGKWNDGVIE